MENNNRFSRTESLLGQENFSRLRMSTVMIIGLGAVGGYVLEALARAGINHLILVDFDCVEISNINRQILALDSTIGNKKSVLAAQRVQEINPDCHVEIFDLFVNADTLSQLPIEKTDFVVDAIDSLNPKCLLIETLYRKRIPFISSMGAALKTDPSKIKLQPLDKTQNCPLARFVRKRLKRRGCDLKEIICVSSDEIVHASENALFIENNNSSRGRSRHTMGSLPTVTAIFGLTIANEVILRLSGYK